MKKMLMVLGVILVVLIIVGTIVFSVIAVKGWALDAESKAYVDEVTPKILANLNKETLFQYASDELLKAVSSEEFDKMFNWFAKLGQFKEYKNSNGQAYVSLTIQGGKQITGIYQAQAEFENGPAIIKIKTIKKGDNWQIISFFISSKALVNE